MKGLKLFSVLVILVLLVSCSGQKVSEQETVQTGVGEVVKVGEPLSLTETTALNDLLMQPAQYVGKTLLLEGAVKNRCDGTGCWVSIAENDSSEIFYVKSSDHSFIFPEECVNRSIRVQGDLMVVTPEAEEGHKHEEGADLKEGHVCPSPTYFLNPVGMEFTPEKGKESI